MKTMRSNGLLLGVAMSLSVIGCQSQPPQSQVVAQPETWAIHDDWAPPGARNIEQWRDKEVAAGAAATPTLYPAHFTGAELNTLGTTKLDHIIAADGSSQAIKIYLDLPKNDPAMGDRKEAVAAYLKREGVKPELIALVDGPDLDVHYPVTPGVKAVDTLDAASGSFTASDSTGGSSGGSGASSGH